MVVGMATVDSLNVGRRPLVVDGQGGVGGEQALPAYLEQVRLG